MRRIWLAWSVSLVVIPNAFGQPKDAPKPVPPQPLYALQLGADAGKTTKLTLRGLRLDMATEVRIGDPKSSGRVVGKGRKVAVPNQMSPETVGDTEIDVQVTLPAEVPGGVVPLSLVGPGGEGKPCILLVNSDTPRVQEKEPNDGLKQAMPLTVPVMVEASFKQPQDVDVYRVNGKAGEKLRIEIQARRYGSPADAILAVYDSAGQVVAAGETTAIAPDPVIRITIPKDGAYLVSAIEASDQGGPMFVYRLVIRREP
jgi:Bacterial pre-peptidase C-terminal domain